MSHRLLDIENIGRIGQMFLSGDLLQKVLVDAYTWDEDEINYDIPVFNALKATLLKIERINPDMRVAGRLWLWYGANRRMAIPVMRCTEEGGISHIIQPASPALLAALRGGQTADEARADGRRVFYFPLRDSTDTVVGALELAEGTGVRPFVYRYDTVTR